MANDSPPLPQIPPEIQQFILPNKDSSVTDFLKFHLPAAAQTTNGSFNQSQKLLSNLIPTITGIEDIRAIPTPPLAIVNELIEAPELSESQSVHCFHVLGLITHWLPDDVQLPDATETLPEDVEHDTELEDQDSDDSDLSLETLITALTKDVPDTVGSRKSGKLALLTDTENVDLVPEMLEQGNSAAEGGRGKRNKVANKQYQGFWQHHDRDDWNDDSLLPFVG